MSDAQVAKALEMQNTALRRQLGAGDAGIPVERAACHLTLSPACSRS